ARGGEAVEVVVGKVDGVRRPGAGVVGNLEAAADPAHRGNAHRLRGSRGTNPSAARTTGAAGGTGGARSTAQAHGPPRAPGPRPKTRQNRQNRWRLWHRRRP